MSVLFGNSGTRGTWVGVPMINGYSRTFGLPIGKRRGHAVAQLVEALRYNP
jgi:hypothetical protein